MASCSWNPKLNENNTYCRCEVHKQYGDILTYYHIDDDSWMYRERYIVRCINNWAHWLLLHSVKRWHSHSQWWFSCIYGSWYGTVTSNSTTTTALVYLLFFVVVGIDFNGICIHIFRYMYMMYINVSTLINVNSETQRMIWQRYSEENWIIH